MNTKRIFNMIILLFAITSLFTSCKNNKTVKTYSLKNLPPLVLQQKGNELFQYWEFEDDLLWHGIDSGQISSLRSYKDSLEITLGSKTFLQAVQKEANQGNSLDTLSLENGDLFNAQLIHSGNVGKIKRINFLEAQILNYQLTRYPLLSHPTEFHAFILYHDSLNHLKLYFAASDQPWPPKPNVILESITKDLKHGWHLKYHLHNHYEPKANNYVGILAPSLADAQYFIFLSGYYGLENALITNGFNTVKIKRKEFSKFRSHSN